MSTPALSLCAILVSFASLALLAWLDPMRLRAVATREQALVRRQPLRAGQRRALAALALVPGLGITLAGDWAALLIWAGASLTFGWALVSALAGAHRSRAF